MPWRRRHGRDDNAPPGRGGPPGSEDGRPGGREVAWAAVVALACAVIVPGAVVMAVEAYFEATRGCSAGSCALGAAGFGVIAMPLALLAGFFGTLAFLRRRARRRSK